MKRSSKQARVISAENFELVQTYISYKNLISKIDPVYVNDEIKEKNASSDFHAGFEEVEDAHFEEVTRDEMLREKARQSLNNYGHFGDTVDEELKNIRYRILRTRELSDLSKDHYSPLEKKRERFYQTNVRNLYTPKGGWYDSGQ